MNSTLQDQIERELVIRAPKERVYKALTDPEQLIHWFPQGVEGKIEAGERPVFNFGEYGKFAMYVVAADPYVYFAYRCVSSTVYCPQGFLGDPLSVPNLLVEFRLEDVEEGTLVKFLESGFASLPIEEAAQTMQDNAGGWDFMLGRLEEFLGQE